MGYGSTIIMIMLFVNVLIFIGALATDNSEINTPVIATMVAIAEGDTLSLIPALASFIGSSGTVIGLIILGLIALSVATGTNYITTGGGYGVVHAPMLIGLFIFMSLTLIPNFDVMGFPYPLNTILYAVFGLMSAVGVYGVIRGE